MPIQKHIFRNNRWKIINLDIIYPEYQFNFINFSRAQL